MASFCIPSYVVDRLKSAVKNGELTMEMLLDSSSPETHAIFSQYMDESLAHEVNLGFEKAKVSKQKDAMKGWIDNTFKPQDKQSKSVYEKVIKKIDKMEELGVLGEGTEHEGFLYDLVSDTLGISLSPDEVKTVYEKATKIEDLSKTRTDTGSFSVDYFKARTEMDDYLTSLNPAHKLKVLTSVYGRANLLGLKSAIVNPISTAFPSTTMAITRRINAGRMTGANTELANAMEKEAGEIWSKSGVDVTRMDTINPGGKLRVGEKVTPVESTGKFGKATKIYADIIFNKFMGGPDVFFARKAFYDNLNLLSDKMANGDKAKAAEIMKDANRIDAVTNEGKILRALAIADARYSTYTESGAMGDIAMNIRTAINKASGDLMAGEFMIPFVKQPANAVQRSVESTGVGAFMGWTKLKGALAEARAGNQIPLLNTTRLFVESGFGISLAALIVFSLNPDDFIPDYDLASPKEREMVKMKNATYNSIKIGGTYISLDYFGTIAAPLVGWLYARKFGNNLTEKSMQIIPAVLGQASRLPGISEISDLIGNWLKAAEEGGDLGKQIQSGFAGLISGVLSRLILQSGTLSDIDKAFDNQRESQGDAVSKLINNIPVLRRFNPVKINQQTGEVLKNENLAFMLLFGSRLKTAVEDPVVDEVKRLASVKAAPAVSDIKYASSRVIELREQLTDDKFQAAILWYSTKYHQTVLNKIKTGDYKKLIDKEKASEINKIRNNTMDAMLIQFKYTKPKK